MTGHPLAERDGVLRRGRRRSRLNAIVAGDHRREVLAATLVLQEQRRLAACRDRIATYKIPRYVKFVDEYPSTANGKVQKFRIREQAIVELGLTA